MDGTSYVKGLLVKFWALQISIHTAFLVLNTR